jgi:hypothetical protein
VAFAVLAASLELFGSRGGGFNFLHSQAAMVILTSYIVAYAIRIYIMNFYKNTRPKGMPQDNRGFFAVEQIAASISMVLLALAVFWAPHWWPGLGGVRQIASFVTSVRTPAPHWAWAALSGIAFGIVAFFSVFIFMFKGRTATFAGLVNRLTSLVAGTAATLIGHWLFHSHFPSLMNWVSLGFVMVAVLFLTRAEKKRTLELKAALEL